MQMAKGKKKKTNKARQDMERERRGIRVVQRKSKGGVTRSTEVDRFDVNDLPGANTGKQETMVEVMRKMKAQMQSDKEAKNLKSRNDHSNKGASIRLSNSRGAVLSSRKMRPNRGQQSFPPQSVRQMSQSQLMKPVVNLTAQERLIRHQQNQQRLQQQQSLQRQRQALQHDERNNNAMVNSSATALRSMNHTNNTSNGYQQQQQQAVNMSSNTAGRGSSSGGVGGGNSNSANYMGNRSQHKGNVGGGGSGTAYANGMRQSNGVSPAGNSNGPNQSVSAMAGKGINVQMSMAHGGYGNLQMLGPSDSSLDDVCSRLLRQRPHWWF
eukprot:g1208.t1